MKVKDKIKNLKEEFSLVDVRDVDSKNRINLGKLIKLVSKIVKAKTNGFEVYYGEDGDILLRPRVSIPAREAWVYKNPEVIDKIRRGVKDLKEKNTQKVEDLDKFFREL